MRTYLNVNKPMRIYLRTKITARPSSPAKSFQTTGGDAQREQAMLGLSLAAHRRRKLGKSVALYPS